eukprot:2977805-Heterocapsa_arctica.AAC.1
MSERQYDASNSYAHWQIVAPCMETMVCPCRPNVALRLVRRDGNMCLGDHPWLHARHRLDS